jgi:hypothetical protein
LAIFFDGSNQGCGTRATKSQNFWLEPEHNEVSAPTPGQKLESHKLTKMYVISSIKFLKMCSQLIAVVGAGDGLWSQNFMKTGARAETNSSAPDR